MANFSYTRDDVILVSGYNGDNLTNNDRDAGVGDFVIIDFHETMPDGTRIYGKLEVVSKTHDDLPLSLNFNSPSNSENPEAGSVPITLNTQDGDAFAGEEVTLRLMFIDADEFDATGSIVPLSVDGSLTFVDIDGKNLPEEQRERVILNKSEFDMIEATADTDLDFEETATTFAAVAPEGDSRTNQNDSEHWLSGHFTNQSSIEFTLRAKDTGTGYSLSASGIENGQTLFAAPVDGDESNSFAEGTTAAVVTNVLVGAVDPDGGTVSLDTTFAPVITGGAGGAIANANGTISYTPGAGDVAGDVITIQYRVVDDEGDTDLSTLTLTVSGVVTQPPVDGDETATFAEGATMAVVTDVIRNAVDPDGGPVILDTDFTPIVSGGTGTAVANSDGTISYIPNADDVEGDVITILYQVVDDEGDTDTSTLTLTVTERSVDTDGDGVVDGDDIDDDNDGILDTDEGSIVLHESFEDVSVSRTNANNIIGSSLGDWETDNGRRLNIIRVDGSDYSVGAEEAADGNQYLDIAGNASLQRTLTVTDDGTAVAFSVDFANRDVTRSNYQNWTSRVEIVNAAGNVVAVGNSVAFNPTVVDTEWFTSTVNTTLDAGTYTFRFYLGDVGHADNIKITLDTDTDGDGIADRLDLDSDNDGIADIVEGGNAIATGLDTDANGTITEGSEGVDTDGNGLIDALESTPGAGDAAAPVDSDGDGLADVIDLDSDGDTIADYIEGRSTDDFVRYDNTDTDGDGIIDLVDQSAGFGGSFASAVTDTDGDGTADALDLDSDNDGLADDEESGITASGSQTNGIDNAAGVSFDDQDGTSDSADTGVDGLEDRLANVDSDPSDVDFRSFQDTDGDGVADADDIDDDNDGILDVDEGIDHGTLAVTADMGLSVAFSLGDNAGGTYTPPANSFNRTSAVGSYAVTASEWSGSAGEHRLDFDQPLLDGTLYFQGVHRLTNLGRFTVILEDGTTIENTGTFLNGANNDFVVISSQVNDAETFTYNGDTYYSGDGRTGGFSLVFDEDSVPGLSGSNGIAAITYYQLGGVNANYSYTIQMKANVARDTDGDGIIDSLDLDSDNDGISDLVESGNAISLGLDANQNGTLDEGVEGVDVDGNGLIDALESAPGAGDAAAPVDSDGDGLNDSIDLDSDADGISDYIEARPTNLFVPYSNSDSDGDGIIDVADQTAGFGGDFANAVTDTDGDGTRDALDLDSDNDLASDADESGIIAAGTSTNGINDGAGVTLADQDGTSDDPATGVAGLEQRVDNTGDNDTTEVDFRSINLLDTDSDGTADQFDIDDDNDGILDVDEGRHTSLTLIDPDAGLSSGLNATGTATQTLTSSDNGAVVAVTVSEVVEGGAWGAWTPPAAAGGSFVDPNGEVFALEGNGRYLDVIAAGGGVSRTIQVDFAIQNTGIANDDLQFVIAVAGLGEYSATDPGSIINSSVTLTKLGDIDAFGSGSVATLDGVTDPAVGLSGTQIGVAPEDGGTAFTFFAVEAGATSVTLEVIDQNVAAGQGTDQFGFSFGFVSTKDTDSDGDGVVDRLDLDSDNDGISDLLESGNAISLAGDANENGTLDEGTEGVDVDGNGLIDALESAPGVGDAAAPVDSDGDGLIDSTDLDADGDGISDYIESRATGAFVPYSDADADGDGVIDLADQTAGFGGDFINALTDTDGDGTADALDLDSDNDTASDADESGIVATGTSTNGIDDGSGVSFADQDGTSDDPATGLAGLEVRLDNTSDNDLTEVDFRSLQDTDGDGTADVDDIDDDNDGILDTDEGEGDTDGDGIIDRLDLDSDNDGIADLVESGNAISLAADANENGTLDEGSEGADVDGNGLIDALESAPGVGDAAGPVDSDGDGLIDSTDLDADGDGISDYIEARPTGSFVAYDDADADGDGIIDLADQTAGFGGNFINALTDTDGDGTADALDLNSDNDEDGDAVESGITPAGTSTNGIDDGSGVSFDDQDGTSDDLSPGLTGLEIRLDNTGDNDPTEVDFRSLQDTDGDGTADIDDIDDDNDGILDTDEGEGDTDGDGIIDRLDLDSDNDGIADLVESGNATSQALDADENGTIDEVTEGVDTDGNGLIDALETNPGDGDADAPVDSDGDGLIDSTDLDADGDGISDYIEALPTDAFVPYDDADSDGDGIIDLADQTVGFGGNFINALTDTDGDGTVDALDLNSDNDATDDAGESGIAPAGTSTNGIDDGSGVSFDDQDGTSDDPATGLAGLEVRVDNTGDNDLTEVDFRSVQDTDGDGTGDDDDIDDDNDGILDTDEGEGDTDGDGIIDRLDLDSDNDGIADLVESGNAISLGDDANENGTLDEGPEGADVDGNGLIDALETNPGDGDAAAPVDSDGDGLIDSTDLDADGDGISDFIESRATGAFVPYSDADADGDGVIDIADQTAGFGGDFINALTDTDGDGTVDALDLDSDNDTASDTDESGIIAAGTSTDGIDDGSGVTLDDQDGTSDDPTPGLAGLELRLDNTGDNDPTDVDFRSLQDTDGDGTADVDDIDDDNDGILDTDEGEGDNDGDGILDRLDLDSDNDGIADLVESGNAISLGLDVDENGTIDEVSEGVDVDGNGLIDALESGQGVGDAAAPVDSDSDGLIDSTDLDSDADGISDFIEASSTAAFVAYDNTDSDGDGIIDLVDSSAGFGGDFVNTLNDNDGDGVADATDTDSDGDGIDDAMESAIIAAGTLTNGIDDGSGVTLDDQDGTSDDLTPGLAGLEVRLDNTGDNDPTDVDFRSLQDTDGDGTPDVDDIDDDNDGILDTDEGEDDADGDGIINRLDLDSDNDGIADIVEGGNLIAVGLDVDKNGTIDEVSEGVDVDGNGLIDALESGQGVGDAAAPVDSDSDGLIDSTDLDSDADGISDFIEASSTAAFVAYDNTDSDGDGIIDLVDSSAGFGGDFVNTLNDNDGDGVADATDTDSDDDGLTDEAESGLVTLGTLTNGIDDGSGVTLDDQDGVSDDLTPGLAGLEQRLDNATDNEPTDVDFRSVAIDPKKALCSSDFAVNGLNLDPSAPGVILGVGGPLPLFGTAGNDTIIGSSGTEFVISGAGNNLIALGDENDVVSTGMGDDTIDAGEGANGVNFGGGNNLVRAGAGSDVFTGGQNDDTVISTGGDDVYNLFNGNNVVCAGGGNDFINVGFDDDCIVDEGGDNTIVDTGGNNEIFMGDGLDVITTGGGDDTIEAGAGEDVIDAGDGDNLIDAGAGSDRITTGVGMDTIAVGAGDDTVNAGDGADVVQFVFADNLGATNLLNGEGGNDSLELTFTQAEFASSAIQADLQAANTALAAGQDYTFNTIDLTLQDFETIGVFVV